MEESSEDKVAADELTLFIENDATLYRARKEYVANLDRKRRRRRRRVDGIPHGVR